MEFLMATIKGEGEQPNLYWNLESQVQELKSKLKAGQRWKGNKVIERHKRKQEDTRGY